MVEYCQEIMDALETLKIAEIPVHFDKKSKAPDETFWITKSWVGKGRLLCEGRKPLYNDVYYTNNPEIVTCRKCLEWLHA